MDVHEFDPVIYPFKLWVMIGNIDKIPSLFLSYDGKEIKGLTDSTSSFNAFTMLVMHKEKHNYGVLVHFENKKVMTCGTVAHEACHAAKFLFEHIGASVSDHEPLEYAVGWIADCCWKVKNQKNTINNCG